jgi:hypothetical protein
MNTTLYETKDRARGIRAGQRHIGGEQCRREMRAALHDLQQRLGQSHNGLSVGQPVVKAGPAPSTECRMRGKLFRRLKGFYAIFTSCTLV